MGKADFITKMEECMMGIGNTTKCMGKENYIIDRELLPMTEFGKMTNFKERASYTMKLPTHSPLPTTITILIMWTNSGNTMKVFLFLRRRFCK